MAINNFELGIRSVTYTRNPDGELVEQDSVDWAINDYHVNNQAVEAEPAIEPFAGSAAGRSHAPGEQPKRKTRKRKPKPVAQETPKQVGEELVEKAHQRDLKKRGLK